MFSYDPLIIYVSDWIIRYRPVALLRVLRQFSNRNIYLLILLSWAHDNPYLIKQLKLWQERHLRWYPRHRIIFMANSEAEHRMLTAAGMGTAWVNHNAFVSPAIFRNLQESDKRFDAVYDARVDLFKRHKLAVAIESLALITAPSQHDKSYTRSIRRILTHAYWFNDPLASNYRFMSLSEINSAINQCRVGLCLSATEGAMYASMQYLLAGLPIVSTESRGGRDEFFDSDYVRIVADRADAVAAGVREMRNCPVPPEEIRHRTLKKAEQHKTRLFELLDNICATEGCHVDLRCRWDSWASGSLTYPATPASIRKRIENAAISSTYSPK